MPINDIIFYLIFLIAGFYIGFNRKFGVKEKKENTLIDEVLFDQTEYDEDYFLDPIKREEARKIWMEYSLQKINQHIVYSLGSIGTIITILNLNIHVIFKGIALLNIIFFLIYMIFRIVYWSVYHDYSMNVAPKMPKKHCFFSQDNLLNRYKWAVDYRMGEPDTPRQKFAKFVKSRLFKILFFGSLLIFNLIYIARMQNSLVELILLFLNS